MKPYGPYYYDKVLRNVEVSNMKAGVFYNIWIEFLEGKVEAKVIFLLLGKIAWITLPTKQIYQGTHINSLIC